MRGDDSLVHGSGSPTHSPLPLPFSLPHASIRSGAPSGESFSCPATGLMGAVEIASLRSLVHMNGRFKNEKREKSTF